MASFPSRERAGSPGPGRRESGAVGTPPTPDASSARVLVVDDEDYNRELLRVLLEPLGFQVDTVGDGDEALERVWADPPDVVLLDVMMPGTDGFGVCRRLKGSPTTAHIPVLLVTALSGRGDRLEGIEAGADDFLTKPVDRHEVQLRVRNAIYRKQLFDALARKFEQLREMETMREELTQMLVHDMRSPLSAIATNLQLLETSLGADPDEDALEDLRQARLGVGTLLEMVAQILDVSRAEASSIPLDPEEVGIGDLVNRALVPLQPLARDHPLEVDLSDAPETLRCDPDLIRRTLANLVGNAVKFTPPGTRIRIRCRAAGEAVRLEVEDDGPGIEPEVRAGLFEKFAGPASERARRKLPYSTGLGLAFCRLAVEAHGGRIGVESEPGEGAVFWVELPPAPEGQGKMPRSS